MELELSARERSGAPETASLLSLGRGSSGPAPPVQRDPLTFRAVAIGCLVGMVTATMNVSFGLKAGWSQGGSILAAVVSIGVFSAMRPSLPFTAGEANICQTTASAAGMMTMAAGFAGPIPALQMLGYEYSTTLLLLWAFSVCYLGVFFCRAATAGPGGEGEPALPHGHRHLPHHPLHVRRGRGGHGALPPPLQKRRARRRVDYPRVLPAVPREAQAAAAHRAGGARQAGMGHQPRPAVDRGGDALRRPHGVLHLRGRGRRVGDPCACGPRRRLGPGAVPGLRDRGAGVGAVARRGADGRGRALELRDLRALEAPPPAQHAAAAEDPTAQCQRRRQR
mmetsp:Transcript_39589/g.126397  ORF Transcript_39589/g.126397 Transcript_39589/m.126397 type:complete len:337 (+) Transcript_39589:2307-3317(+)